MDVWRLEGVDLYRDLVANVRAKALGMAFVYLIQWTLHTVKAQSSINLHNSTGTPRYWELETTN